MDYDPNPYNPLIHWFSDSTEQSAEDSAKKGCASILIGFFIGAIVCLLLCLCSCSTTRYVEVPSTHKDVEYVDKWSTDTLIQTNTIVVSEKGDTIRETLYRDRIKVRVDSVLIERVDSIVEPYAVETIKEVNYLTPFQKCEIAALWCIVGVGLIWLAWKMRK
ncbi:MAG: hypothetical protein LIP02_10455 [Bacteroidales bacterium]|nr:hypothetical protein [Bacteroidales bacterium]